MLVLLLLEEEDYQNKLLKLRRNSNFNKICKRVPTISELMTKPNTNQVVEGKVDDWYLSDFINFSKKDIYTLDETKLNDFSDLSYHLVASLIYPLKVKSLPRNKQPQEQFKKGYFLNWHTYKISNEKNKIYWLE